MNQIILLQKTLKPLLGWHGTHLNFLAHLQPGQTPISSRTKLIT